MEVKGSGSFGNIFADSYRWKILAFPAPAKAEVMLHSGRVLESSYRAAQLLTTAEQVYMYMYMNILRMYVCINSLESRRFEFCVHTYTLCILLLHVLLNVYGEYAGQKYLKSCPTSSSLQ